MTTSTALIVLSKSNYSESSIVVQCFSRQYGKVGLLVTGVKKRKARVKIALFEPLSILEVHANFASKKGLVIPKEVKVVVPLLQMQASMVKRSVAFFLSEILHKSMLEASPDENAFDFMQSAIEYLNYSQHSISSFHIVFLLKFTRFLGFQPMITKGQYFDLYDGAFSNNVSPGAIYFDDGIKEVFKFCFGANFDEWTVIQLSVENRNFLIDFILKYYQAHIPGMGQIKSHHILEEIFH